MFILASVFILVCDSRVGFLFANSLVVVPDMYDSSYISDGECQCACRRNWSKVIVKSNCQIDVFRHMDILYKIIR